MILARAGYVASVVCDGGVCVARRASGTAARREGGVTSFLGRGRGAGHEDFATR